MKLLSTFAIFTAILFSSNLKIPNSFKADFIQRIKSPHKKIIKYKGTILYSYPTSIKWIYKSPTKKEVCARNGFAVVIDHDLEQVNRYSIDKGLNLAAILKRAMHYKKNIYVTKYKGKYYTIVTDKKGRILQIAYKDDLDNTVNIFFKHIKYLSKPLPKKLLTCKIPKNYDIIR